ncbi:MAG: CotH kinase family protein [Saprospiraceae bacterium]|nr:CotH kinase family protein [Saprospiraceae bacterium]
MILKQVETKRPALLISLLWLLPFSALALLLNWTYSWMNEPRPEDQENLILNCSLEETDGEFFTADTFRLKGSVYQTRDEARSGRQSMALSATQKYGLEFYYSLNKYNSFLLSVWRYNPHQVSSYLVATAHDTEQFYIATDQGTDSDDHGWEKLSLLFHVPPGIDQIKIYCYADGSEDMVYFDDMTLYQMSPSMEQVDIDLPRIDIQVAENDLRKLRRKRDEAWEAGLLIVEENDWVKTRIVTEGVPHEGKLRLKGDWLDHLKEEKWSFRIKMNTGLWGMKTFNVQAPETRGFVREWIYHKWLAKEDILSPRYKFLLIYLNGKFLGIYACEEHFEKELVESRQRREGVILKFSEDRFWQGVERQFAAYGKNQFRLADSKEKESGFWSSEVQPFKEKEVRTTPQLSDQFSRGSQLMQRYKYGTDPLHTLLDPENLGKYLAIVEITRAYHSLTWHNQRWYYNPVTDYLEPIGFDGFSESHPALHLGKNLFSESTYSGDIDAYEPCNMFYKDPIILSYYVNYLHSFSHPQYIEPFLTEIESQTAHYVNLLRKEYPRYHYEVDEIRQHTERIRLILYPYSETSVTVHPAATKQNALEIKNGHVLPIQITGSSTGEGAYYDMDPVLILPNAKSKMGQVIEFDQPMTMIYFQQPGLDSIYRISVSQWKKPPVVSPDFEENFSIHPRCKVVGTEIFLNSGQLSAPLIIPEGYRVVIPSSTKLDLVDRAFIYSRSPLSVMGVADDPVIINSTDGSGAVIIMDASHKSTFTHTNFVGLGTLKHNQYVLTGGVTLHESPSSFQHCVFRDSKEEDALNIIRSNFTMTNCLFENTAFDALDADFSEGTISHCWYKTTGNDAMDFSGSKIKILETQLQQIGDKGVSVGEHSTVHIHSISIDDARTGVACKDQSLLTISHIDLSNTSVGFTAFQKKAMFGPAEIRVDNYTAAKVQHLHIIEPGSSLILAGDQILPQ